MREGETLHLRVQEVTEERVTLGSSRRPPRPPACPPRRRRRGRRAWPSAEPPRRRPGGDEESATVALAFDSAVLGRLDLRIDLARGGVQAAVEAPAGAASSCATEAAGRLQDALAGEDRAARPPSASRPPRAVRRLCLSRRGARATALRYEGSGAPKVVATGQGAVADRILAHAREAGVPVREDPALAAALAAWRSARRSRRSCGWPSRRCWCGRTGSERGGEYPEPVMWGRDPRADTTCTRQCAPRLPPGARPR